MQQIWKRPKRLSSWDFAYALDMAIACAILLAHYRCSLPSRQQRFRPGGWDVGCGCYPVRVPGNSPGMARLIATCVSFALCLLYLWVFPFTALGMAVLLGIGTLAMMLLNRRDDIVTTAITTAVVMVVAGMSPLDGWHQPLLRLIDTVAGIAVGVGCKWIGSSVFFRLTGKPVR
jgi:hypothetical protein